MELSTEGLAAAAATREALAIKKRQLEEGKKTDEASTAPDKKPGVPAKKPHLIRPPPACTHEVAIPNGFDMDKLTHDEVLHGTLNNPTYHGTSRAKQYPFVLDPFQETAIACLERRESVLVAAHTSAGKTVVAEYAIAMAAAAKQRVIYTSPIKALSNQKYRELSEEFGDVGLMTGDVVLNPNAFCIVMTTEILRSMIYRGSELLREVAWVIFDEVHYMKDRERGVVWEETIIFLADETKMVFLSATLSNASEFAGWVAHLHKQPCHVVYTDYRPTPLQHYAYALGGSGLHLVLDERGVFRSDNFAKMRETFQVAPPNGEAAKAEEGEAGGRGGGRGGRGGRNARGGGRAGRGGRGGGAEGGVLKAVGTILNVIKAKEWDPVIFFSFARKDCELYAGSLKNVDFNNDEEKVAIEEVFKNALQCLNVEDRELPAIEKMLPLLLRGIGVHHSGLLPILKELIEILFSEQLIKVLFATETFAMGINMPARTVVFTATRKFDGEVNRVMESGEYIQMSGRAGRRGKDDRGLIIMMVDQDMEEAACRSMCCGKPSPMLSSFKLSYYTMLNMLRRLEGSQHNMEYVIKNSFQQFQQERELPEIQQKLLEIEARAAEAGREGDEAILQYKSLLLRQTELETALRAVCMQPQHCLQFLRAGRVVAVKDGETDWGYGVVVSVMRRPGGLQGSEAHYTCDTLLACDPASLASGSPRPAMNLESASGNGKQAPIASAEMVVIPVGLPLLTKLSTLRISIPQDLRPAENRRSVLLQLQELMKRHAGVLPQLDPVEDMGITDPELLETARIVQDIEAQLQKNPVHQASEKADASERFEAYVKRAALLAEADALRTRVHESQLMSFREEAKSRKEVLRKLGHIDEEEVVLLKGRAACEIDAADELVATELLFNGALCDLDKHQLVALLSCLVPVEKSGEAIKLTQAMAGPLSQLQETARTVAEVSRECKLEVVVDDFIGTFKPFLMDIMYSWSKGASFRDICLMTDIYEGSIIRATRRLDELMQQLTAAAKVVGDTQLAARIEESNMTIRRDIIFAASLYI